MCAEYKMKEYGREEGLAAGTMRVALMAGLKVAPTTGVA